MLRYAIEVGGRIRQVALERAGDGFAVALDGRTWHIDASRIDAHILSLILDNDWARKDTDGRASVEVTVVPGRSSGELTVLVGAAAVAVNVDGRRRWGRSDDASGVGPQRIVAPMPGKVVRIFVRPGDAVTARQPLVVVEAMKMENELRASRDGTVAEVLVREGVSVDAGAPLIVIL